MTRRRRVAARIPALLRDQGFRNYWSGQTISMFGDQVSSIALPLVAVLTLRASPAQMGLLTALVWLPSLLFGLHAGALADRRGHWRATMIAADLGRTVLLASIPACYALGVLTIWQAHTVDRDHRGDDGLPGAPAFSAATIPDALGPITGRTSCLIHRGAAGRGWGWPRQRGRSAVRWTAGSRGVLPRATGFCSIWAYRRTRLSRMRVRTISTIPPPKRIPQKLTSR